VETRAVLTNDGAVRALQLADSNGDVTELALDMVIFSAGIRPRDELARASGLAIGPRGGIVVDAACRTSDHDILAIGECALAAGQIWGLVAPGYTMAKVACDVLLDRNATFEPPRLSTKLKLLGIDVASFGDAHAARESCRRTEKVHRCPKPTTHAEPSRKKLKMESRNGSLRRLTFFLS
jgi:nitrite reductase (NADH) large subunit